MVDARTGKRMHTAIRYGVTQALLDAVAKAQHKLMAEVVAEEWQTGGISEEPIRIFTQSGDNRYDNVDKMIIKEAPTLPHGLINHVTAALPQEWGIDQTAVYGDYFYLEALARYKNPDFKMHW